MCYFGPILQGTLGIGGALLGASSQKAAAEAQMQGSIKAMNFNLQNLELQRQDAFDSAVQEIMDTRLNAQGLNAGVEAAIGQDLAGGGRTAELLMRATKGDELRTVGSVKDNYSRKSNEVDLNKETTVRNTQDQLKAIEKSTSNNNLTTALSIASIGLGAYGQAQNMSADASAGGYSLDFWGRRTYRGK